MNKILIIIIVLFPYTVAFSFISIFTGFLMESLFENNGLLLFFTLLCFWFIAFIYSIIQSVRNLKRPSDFLDMCHMNMLIKTLSIPAYIFMFIFGLICIFTIFTIGFTIVAWILCILSITLSGIVSISASKCCYDTKAFSLKQALLFGVLQFIFVADVISAILMLKKAKQKVL